MWRCKYSEFLPWRGQRVNIIKFRKDMQIIEDLNRIWNVDETPIWFDMTYNTTISKIGEKSIKVRTFG